jgi:hypothetical protein
MLPTWPSAKELIADRGYDSAQSRAELAQRRITACIPSTRFHKRPIPHDVMLSIATEPPGVRRRLFCLGHAARAAGSRWL